MKKVFCIVLLFTSCLSATGQSVPVLKFREGSVWVTGLRSTSIAEDQWKEFLRVFTHEAFVKRVNQSVGGMYTWHGDSLAFTPNFSFAPGGTYHAVFGKLELAFSIAEEKFAETFIESVYPQAEVLPENMLRMYISFSAPMMPGEAYEHITLFREDGTAVEKAFLIIDQELWDAERKRFTLLFDPGRVKRGIQSNVELGAPLQAGQKYRLVVDANWRDAKGKPLSGTYEKLFSVAQAERAKLTVAAWKLVTPAAGSHGELLIAFDRPMDEVLASKCITIHGKQSGPMAGHATLTGSNLWRFTPQQPWAADEYHVEVLPHLEDVAGNNLNNAFDIDLSKESRVNSSAVVKIPFLVSIQHVTSNGGVCAGKCE